MALLLVQEFKKTRISTLNNEKMNNITIIGRLGADAEVKMVNDNYVYTFRVAEDAYDKGEKNTYWWRVNMWRKDDKLKLLKGQKIAVVGRLRQQSYEKEGVKMQSVDIIAHAFEFCESKDKQDDNDDLGF